MTDVRILIVEDDPFIAMDIEAVVAEHVGDGAELIVVESVEEACRQAEKLRLSCALLDIDVVGGKTFGVAESLMQRGTPFAFVSGSTPKDVPSQLQHIKFLRKPFATSEIAGFVAGALGLDEAAAQTA